MLRVLRQLARSHHRATAVTDLMAYLPTAVDIGYLRHDFEIPLPGPGFASRVGSLLRDGHQVDPDTDVLEVSAGTPVRAENRSGVSAKQLPDPLVARRPPAPRLAFGGGPKGGIGVPGFGEGIE
ncbi:hypothetical protein ACKI1I_33690 [Streptomyces turgidiscabies]|uniref:Uncharacterized protein n=1 Tax=Streptomyces turgidiscabies (strain Car8) TaxID=698760 RepID=L7ETP9_STRT8|nr:MULTISPECIES: hypothetical protein [Streptomyces]ELP62254.1 hypothetical protein STRTUCAR8_04758 [Streptomyces turgidiscabies Car8]MDX3498742.1 hypothetical protein [Streptomyces turgidiscabies]GAQ74830.1 hypothetical protein T45_06610 [Streptomyces turgidiscabies]